MTNSEAILASWNANAQAWVATIENEELESRNSATNNAVVQAIKKWAQPPVIDIGCGEGWLTKQMRTQGLEAYGVDAVAALIDHAKADGNNCFFTVTYRQLSLQQIKFPTQAKTAVINFALIDKDDSEMLVKSFQNWLMPQGRVIIQTLHPFAVTEGNRYQSGWRDGSWAGIKRSFVQPYQWYFRTIADWIQLFSDSKLMVLSVAEPVHPQSGQPLSIIFVLQLNDLK